MIIYLAGTVGSGAVPWKSAYQKACLPAQKLFDSVTHRLESYWYFRNDIIPDEYRSMKFFFDSGAYTAWTKHAEIKLEEYIKFVEENPDIIHHVDGIAMIAGLDQIAGKNPHIVTMRNLKKAEKMGIKMIPTFHQGEPWNVLDYYANHYPYVCIGGITGGVKLESFLDEAWERLISGSGKPITRVHAFGMTADNLMRKYPWYSVDSSRWVQAAANGAIFIRKYGTTFDVSAVSPRRKILGQNIASMSEEARMVMRKVVAESGLTLEGPDGVMESYLSRWAFNQGEFVKLEKELVVEKYIKKINRLF